MAPCYNTNMRTVQLYSLYKAFPAAKVLIESAKKLCLPPIPTDYHYESYYRAYEEWVIASIANREMRWLCLHYIDDFLSHSFFTTHYHYTPQLPFLPDIPDIADIQERHNQMCRIVNDILQKNN